VRGGAVAVDLSHDLVRIPSLSLLPLSFICWLATVRYSMRLYGTPYNGSILYCTRPIVFLLLHKKGLESHHNPPPPFFLHPSRSTTTRNIIQHPPGTPLFSHLNSMALVNSHLFPHLSRPSILGILRPSSHPTFVPRQILASDRLLTL